MTSLWRRSPDLGRTLLFGDRLGRPSERSALQVLPLALGLGGDLLQLDRLKGRQGLARGALLRITEGAAEGLQPVGDGAEELTLSFRQLDAGPVSLALSAFQGVQGGALGLRLRIWRLSVQISPTAAR